METLRNQSSQTSLTHEVVPTCVNVVYKIKRMLNEEPTSFPEWVVPMAATLTQERFTGPEWIFERKLDGIRMLAFKNGAEVRLLSRNKLPLNASYPSVVAAISNMNVHDIILDGEATGAWGQQGEFVYHVFDLLWLNGVDITAL